MGIASDLGVYRKRRLLRAVAVATDSAALLCLGRVCGGRRPGALVAGAAEGVDVLPGDEAVGLHLVVLVGYVRLAWPVAADASDPAMVGRGAGSSSATST